MKIIYEAPTGKLIASLDFLYHRDLCIVTFTDGSVDYLAKRKDSDEFESTMLSFLEKYRAEAEAIRFEMPILHFVEK